MGCGSAAAPGGATGTRKASGYAVKPARARAAAPKAARPKEPQAGKGGKAERVRLDNDYVRKLPVPSYGTATYWDADPKAIGFGLRIYPSGNRSFFVNYRLGGTERKFTVGPFPAWSTSAARDRAIALRKQIDNGEDPTGEKRERREAPVMADLIDRYITEHLPTKTGGEQRIKDEKKMLAIIGKYLGTQTKVGDVHDGDLRDMHRRLTETRGPVRANRILACASKMFSLSLQTIAGENTRWRNSEQGNPCSHVARNPEPGRERFYSPAELARIADCLNLYPPQAYESQKETGRAAADCVRLIMLTGCRPGEAMQAEWNEFDQKPGHWIKPSAHTKQKRTHEIPLAPPAVELIERLRKTRKGKFVFPGGKPGESISTLLHVWNYVKERAQLAPDEKGREARIYDLRHTFATVAVGGGYNLPLIGKMLGHTQSRTTQRYAHSPDDALKQAVDKIGNDIANAGKPGAEIVPIRGGAA